MSKTVYAVDNCPDVVFYNPDWDQIVHATSFDEAKEVLAEEMYKDAPDSELSDEDRIYEASGMIRTLTQKEVLEAAEKGEAWPIKHKLVTKVQLDD